MIAPDFELTTRQLEAVWSDFAVGRLPYPLDVPSLGGTIDERARLRRQAYRELERNDLAREGHLDHRLEALLRLLRNHDVAIDAVARVADRPIKALAASEGGHAVLVVIDEDHVGLFGIQPTALAESIANVLPEGIPGPERGESAHRVAGGQFGVSCRTASRMRGERPSTLITWFDTSQGRYLMVWEKECPTVTPTDNLRIAERIAAVLSTVDV